MRFEILDFGFEGRYLLIVVIPLLLIGFACAAAGFMAYGTDARLGQLEQGVQIIMLARRLQWPLIVVSLLLCLVLFVLIVSGRRRVWWLVGLLPVLALFSHRFLTGPQGSLVARWAAGNGAPRVEENPSFVQASRASFMREDDWIVGLHFSDSSYAYPYAALYRSPVLVQDDREKRLLVMWSAYANAATAVNVDRDFKGRDLEIVSSPANALLVYNRRLGQFINGLTGRVMSGRPPATTQPVKPDGFRTVVPITKTTWRAWHETYPETMVLVPDTGDGLSNTPRVPLLPRYALPKSAGMSLSASLRLVCLIHSSTPIAVPQEAVTNQPVNLSDSRQAVVLFRDANGVLRAFDRHVEPDLTPRFRRNIDAARPLAALVDTDTNTGWTAGGIAVDLPKGAPPEQSAAMRGRRLAPLLVQDGLYLELMRYWYPELRWIESAVAEPDAPRVEAPPPGKASTGTRTIRRKPRG